MFLVSCIATQLTAIKIKCVTQIRGESWYRKAKKITCIEMLFGTALKKMVPESS
jgi:hypothetical protein